MQQLFRIVIEGNESRLAELIDVEGDLWRELLARGVLTGEQIQLCQSERTTKRQIDKMLDLLKKRDDCYYLPFREALKASDQNGVREEYFPEHPELL